MTTQQLQDARRATNPLFNGNRLKLGIFGHNVSHGCAITLAEGHFETNWPSAKAISVLGDRAGFEALVPVARWKGFGGPTNFNGRCFETYTWAAGLAAVTDQAAVFSTSHVPTIHPVVAAKQATTIDHISRGRFALNVVCGWFRPELEMFGASLLEHDTAYEYAAEWLKILRQLWSAEEEFDFEGRFFKIQKGFHEPKPIQRPFPPVMSAGSSWVGERFAAQHADMAFINARGHGADSPKERVEKLRRLAREEFGRELQVWTQAYVVCRPTEREAQDYLRYYVEEKGDWEAVDNMTQIMGMKKHGYAPDVLEARKYHLIAGWGGYTLVGTPTRIVDEVETLSQAGLDGLLLSWVNYETDLEQWNAEVMPLLEQAGLRQPYQPETEL
jgi:FMNH2-dependent dimethyl sulfone monooxygenase